MVAVLLLEFISRQSHLLASYFNILVLIKNRVRLDSLRELNTDLYVGLHFWGVILPFFYFFGDNFIFFIFFAVLLFSIVFILGRFLRTLLNNAMLLVTIAFPLYVISLFSLTFISFWLAPLLNLIVLRFTASLLLSTIYLFFVLLIFCFSASKEHSFPEIWKRYLPITLWFFLLASIMNLTTFVSWGFSFFILFLGLYNYQFLNMFFTETWTPHVLKSNLIWNILRFIPGPIFSLDVFLLDGWLGTLFTQATSTSPILMVSPGKLTDTKGLLTVKANTGLNQTKAPAPKPAELFKTPRVTAPPIHPTEGNHLAKAARETFIKDNYSGYSNTVYKSYYREWFETKRHYMERLVAHGLHESAANPEVHAIVPSEQLFTGETVPVQLRAGNNYLLPNKSLFDAVGGGPLVARHMDVNNLPEGIRLKDVPETGWYFVKRSPRAVEGIFFYQYTRLDPEIEARLDYFSSNLSVFENLKLREPSELAVARNYTKPNSIFSYGDAGPLLKLRFGDLILLGEGGKVLGFAEAKSITMRKGEGVFDENLLDALYGHIIDNCYDLCLDKFNVCVNDEKGARFYSKDLPTKHITKVYVEEVLEKPSVAPHFSEQLFAGEQLLCDSRKWEEVKIHALGKVTSKLEKSDL